MKKTVKKVFHKLGIYEVARSGISKIYYPYKNYKIKKEVVGILSIVKDIFEKENYDYWLDYGTLLGYVRQGSILGHDIDMDFGVMGQSSLSDKLGSYGFKLIQQTFVDDEILTMEQYEYRGVGLDIIYYREEEGKTVTNLWLTSNHTMPQKEAYKNGLGEISQTTFSRVETKIIEFYGVKFKVPKDSEKYLIEHYGKAYMVPKKNWSYDDEKNRVNINKKFKVKFI